MKLLHTSDWHLGRSLHGRKRHHEFDCFLNWLLGTLTEHQIDVLLVAGDIFDTTTPGNRAQSQYYRFLHQVAASKCRHVVVIAGNHDSPTFLDAPKELLRALNVHVVGQSPENPHNEVLVLKSDHDQAELIVCAVPYLRDRDLRQVQPGESAHDKDQRLIEGLYEHYQQVVTHALQLRDQLGADIPVIGMGHLFIAGGQTLEGDGVRELYVGNLAQVGADLFNTELDYVALGHLHVPQAVTNRPPTRYSGSPIPMGFGEARQQKSVCCVTFNGRKTRVEQIDIPRFQRLERVRGDWPDLMAALAELQKAHEPVWLELVYDGQELLPDLRERVQEIVADSPVEVLRLSNRRLMETALAQTHEAESLDSLSADDVFERCLDANEIAEAERTALRATYHHVLNSLNNDDPNAL